MFESWRVILATKSKCRRCHGWGSLEVKSLCSPLLRTTRNSCPDQPFYFHNLSPSGSGRRSGGCSGSAVQVWLDFWDWVYLPQGTFVLMWYLLVASLWTMATDVERRSAGAVRPRRAGRGPSYRDDPGNRNAGYTVLHAGVCFR